jgi:flagellar hook-length control protein FliK
MTIEMSPASTEAKPTVAAETKTGKTGATGTGKPGSGGATGFMSVLASIDSDAAQATPSTESQKGLPALLDDSLSTGLADPTALLGGIAKVEIPMDAAALLAQSLQWRPAEPSGAVGSAGGRQAVLPQTVGAQMGTGLQELGLLSEGVRKPGKGGSDLTTNQQSSVANLASAAGSGGQSQADGRVLPLTPKVENMLAQFSAVETAVAAATGSVEHEEHARDHSIFKPAAVEGGFAPQSTVASTPSTTASSGPGVVAAPEVYVAEQIKYWISNDVQNAEMKLDGIGDNPVEVSISMQGNEAHVAFRTDELQAREILETASVHLKELLQREGLVLSGVSVGTAGAGAGDTGAQDRKSRQGARSAAVVSAQPIRADSGSTSIRTSGRAVDLFV